MRVWRTGAPPSPRPAGACAAGLDPSGWSGQLWAGRPCPPATSGRACMGVSAGALIIPDHIFLRRSRASFWLPSLPSNLMSAPHLTDLTVRLTLERFRACRDRLGAHHMFAFTPSFIVSPESGLEVRAWQIPPRSSVTEEKHQYCTFAHEREAGRCQQSARGHWVCNASRCRSAQSLNDVRVSSRSSHYDGSSRGPL